MRSIWAPIHWRKRTNSLANCFINENWGLWMSTFMSRTTKQRREEVPKNPRPLTTALVFLLSYTYWIRLTTQEEKIKNGQWALFFLRNQPNYFNKKNCWIRFEEEIWRNQMDCSRTHSRTLHTLTNTALFYANDFHNFTTANDIRPCVVDSCA